MDKLDFIKLFSSAGQEFQSRIERTAFYMHPTGVGDAREDLVRDYLREILPPRFSIDRGKIFDSQGNLSREFDVIISESFDISPAMTLANRRIVPIESVYGVIEIKSKLNKKYYDYFIDAVGELDEMRRFYTPLSKIHNQEIQRKVKEGFAPIDKHMGHIWSGIIAIDAPKAKALSKYMQYACEGFWFICVPSRELVYALYETKSSRGVPTGFQGVPYGLMSLPVLSWIITDVLIRNQRPKIFQPDFSRYRNAINNSLGPIPDSWELTLKYRR